MEKVVKDLVNKTSQATLNIVVRSDLTPHLSNRTKSDNAKSRQNLKELQKQYIEYRNCQYKNQ